MIGKRKCLIFRGYIDMSVGSNITLYRKKAGITSRDMAALLDITPATMSRYESGKIISIPKDMLERISGILNCTVDELIVDDPNYSFLSKPQKRKSSSRKKDEEELLKGFYSLSPELQDAVRMICHSAISD